MMNSSTISKSSMARAGKSVVSASFSVVGLQTNWLDFAFGVDTPPVFNWRMESNKIGACQSSYRLKVSKNTNLKNPVWDSGIVASSLSVAIKYEGRALNAATRYYWGVEVTNECGETVKSHIAFFDTGLINGKLWKGAEWIMAKPLKEGEVNNHEAFVVRKLVKNKADVKSVKWFVSGLGVFEAYINGKRVSNLDDKGEELFDELKPGFTDARKMRQYFTYDVTHLFNGGKSKKNVLCAVVTSGWWSDQITGKIGKHNGFLGQLIITYKDGTKELVGTDTSWNAAFRGPVLKAEIHYGEDFDNRQGTEFLTSEKVDKEWGKAVVNDEFKGRIESLIGPSARVRSDLELKGVKFVVIDNKNFDGATEDRYGKVRIIREYSAGDKIKLKSGELLLVDFGQNCVGRERVRLAGKVGTKIVLRHAETVNDNEGLKSRGNDGPEGYPYFINLRAARAATHYTLSGDGVECCNPIFSFYGYRYLSITTSAAIEITEIAAEIVTSVPFGGDNGSITTSDKLVNRLIQNCRWGHYGNYLSVPTDCPQRDERLGWTADTQVFSAAAAYDGASYGFLSKFMRDMRDAQGPEGGFPGVAPYAQYGNMRCGVGWSDAAIVVTYNMYKAYGDKTIIKDNYEALCKYMALLREIIGPIPRWGDWLAYERNDEDIKRYICGAYYIWDARMMIEMARAIGDEEGAKVFEACEYEGTAQFNWLYRNQDGTVKERYACQTAYLFMLHLNLSLDEASEKANVKALLDNIKDHGDRLQTGFLGTAILLNTLTKVGATDVAYKLLLQKNEPSWLYSVLQGATTMWERWNSYTKDKGFGDAVMNSFNHYAYGAVLDWIFNTMAGIRYDDVVPGYKHFVFSPIPDPSVGKVNASYMTPYGLVKSAWEYEGEKWVLNATIPANSTATVKLVCPNGKKITINGKALKSLTLGKDGLRFKENDGDFIILDAVPCSFLAVVE